MITWTDDRRFGEFFQSATIFLMENQSVIVNTCERNTLWTVNDSLQAGSSINICSKLHQKQKQEHKHIVKAYLSKGHWYLIYLKLALCQSDAELHFLIPGVIGASQTNFIWNSIYFLNGKCFSLFIFEVSLCSFFNWN